MAGLEIDLSRTPMMMMYEQTLSLFRNMVNQNHPPQMGAAQNRLRRNVNETNTGRGGRGQSRGGSGRGGRGGRGTGRGGRGNQRTRSDSRMITLTDGSQIEYQASFSFPRHVYQKFKPEDKEKLRRERAAYIETRRHRTEIQELRTQITEQGPFTESPANTAANNECDSNADTCCLGKNFVVLQATYRTADVYAYDSSIQPIENVPIVSGATAYDDPMSGDTFILVFNEALYYGTALDHSLINPNQYGPMVSPCGTIRTTTPIAI